MGSDDTGRFLGYLLNHHLAAEKGMRRSVEHHAPLDCAVRTASMRGRIMDGSYYIPALNVEQISQPMCGRTSTSISY